VADLRKVAEEREQVVLSLQAREKELGQKVEEKEREAGRLREEASAGKDKFNVTEVSRSGKGLGLVKG